MSDADCTPGREPRSVAAIFRVYGHFLLRVTIKIWGFAQVVLELWGLKLRVIFP